MHSVSTGNESHLEAWDNRHPCYVSSRYQAQEGGLTEGQWSYQTIIWNERAPIVIVEGGSVGGCWTTNLPREFCGGNMSEYKLVDINP